MLGGAPAMHLGGAVIDAERAHFAQEASDDRVVGDAEAPEDLHAAVDHPPDRLRADDLGHARLVGVGSELIGFAARATVRLAAWGMPEDGTGSLGKWPIMGHFPFR